MSTRPMSRLDALAWDVYAARATAFFVRKGMTPEQSERLGALEADFQTARDSLQRHGR